MYAGKASKGYIRRSGGKLPTWKSFRRWEGCLEVSLKKRGSQGLDLRFFLGHLRIASSASGVSSRIIWTTCRKKGSS